MTKTVRTLVAIALLSMGGRALAADMPLARPLSTAFSWTNCHLGAHVGGGWAHKTITAPAQLVQDAIVGGTTLGATTVSSNPSGAVIGGQAGCDYQFVSNWVMGVEAAASGSSMKGNTIIVLPARNPGDQALVGARVDSFPA
jgi:outer membrane immunogenic protein